MHAKNAVIESLATRKFDLAEPVELATTDYDIWVKDPHTYGVTVRLKVRKMFALNALTGRYPYDTKFSPADEPVFFVPKTKRAQLANALAIHELPVWL